MAEGNHTIVRVNGCGIVPPDGFLRRLRPLRPAGLAGPCAHLVRQQYKASQRRAAMPALYLDNMQRLHLPLARAPEPAGLVRLERVGPAGRHRRALQNEILPALDGTRPWLPSSSESAALAEGGPAGCRAAAHTSWSACRNTSASTPAIRCYVAKNEIGWRRCRRSTPSSRRFRTTIGRSPLVSAEPHDRLSRRHENYYRVAGQAPSQRGGRTVLPDRVSLEGDLYNSQCYRAIFEAANKARPRNAGTHLWKVNAAWPSMMWQVFDWYLRPNAGYYSMNPPAGRCTSRQARRLGQSRWSVRWPSRGPTSRFA